MRPFSFCVDIALHGALYVDMLATLQSVARETNKLIFNIMAQVVYVVPICISSPQAAIVLTERFQ